MSSPGSESSRINPVVYLYAFLSRLCESWGTLPPPPITAKHYCLLFNSIKPFIEGRYTLRWRFYRDRWGFFLSLSMVVYVCAHLHVCRAGQATKQTDAKCFSTCVSPSPFPFLSVSASVRANGVFRCMWLCWCLCWVGSTPQQSPQ